MEQWISGMNTAHNNSFKADVGSSPPSFKLMLCGRPYWGACGEIMKVGDFVHSYTKGIWQIYRIIKYKNINFQNNKQEKMTYREINILYKTI